MSRIIGIDLGTTNSLVAYMDGDRPTVIRDDSGNSLVPSVVSSVNNGWVIGEGAKKRLLTHPDLTIYSVKRLMGKGLSDVEKERPFFPVGLTEDPPGMIRIALGERTFTPPEISDLILKEVKERAEYESELKQANDEREKANRELEATLKAVRKAEEAEDSKKSEDEMTSEEAVDWSESPDSGRSNPPGKALAPLYL